MSTVLYWIWLASLRGLGPLAARKYISFFGSALRIYEAKEEDYKMVPNACEKEVKALCNKDLSLANKIAADCVKKNIRVISIKNTKYPMRLSYLDDAPIVLYYKGNFRQLDDEAVIGVVGTRKATRYGLMTAERIASEIVCCGGILTTGLAEGIDSAAAVGALTAKGFVIGVLGTGIDVVYPRFNSRLQDAVAESGVLVSEYPPGKRPARSSFPARNRIISGLSLGVVIVEAPERSGSLITASHAAEQGRDIYVVPGRLEDKEYYGSTELIRDGGEFVTTGWDVLYGYRPLFPNKLFDYKSEKKSENRAESVKNDKPAEVKPEIPPKKVIDNKNTVEYIDLKEKLGELSEDERTVISALMEEPMYIDELIRKCGSSTNKALSAITMLELKEFIRKDGSGYYKIVSVK